MYLNGEVILQVDSVKYLGHHLTNDLHDDRDIRRQCRAINVRSNILFRKFHMCSVCIGEIEVIQLLLRFYVYSSLVVELQENVNLQVANNLSQHTQNEHRIV